MSERTDGSQADQLDRLGPLAWRLRGEAGALAGSHGIGRLAARVLPSAERVGLIIVGGPRRWTSAAATDAVAAELDAGQFAVETGPGLDPVEVPDVVVVDDLARDRRWPTFAELALGRGVRAVVCARTPVEGLGRAVLSCYSGSPDTFDASDGELTAVLGAFAASALAAQQQRIRAANLSVALDSNRVIGVAMGIVMARELVTPDQAFDRLRAVSQRRQRKLRDIAEDVVRTGELID